MGIGVFGIPVGIACLILAIAVLVLRGRSLETQKKFGLQEWCKSVLSAPVLGILGALMLWIGISHLSD
jgi:hypothetical protein